MKSLTLFVTLLGLFAAAAGVRAETYRFVPKLFYSTFSSEHPPALTIKSGDRVVTTTVDDMGTDAEGKAIAEGPNPQTGPFFIEGAEPGDLLVVTIEKLAPNRTTGWSTSLISMNAIDPGSITSRPDPTRMAWEIDAAKGIVRFDLEKAVPNTDWKSRYASPVFEMPLQPTLGAIGVAPANKDAQGTTASGPFGGNVVSAAVTAGTRVMLPVFQPGALLFLGHGLARMGDGGVTGTGVETSLDVEFSVEVVKKKEWPHSSVMRPSTVVGEFEQGWPRLETSDYIMTIGTAPSLLEAVQHATLELHHWLDDDFGLSEKLTNVFVGQALEYEISNLDEKNYTVVAKVKKTYLPKPAPGTL